MNLSHGLYFNVLSQNFHLPNCSHSCLKNIGFKQLVNVLTPKYNLNSFLHFRSFNINIGNKKMCICD